MRIIYFDLDCCRADHLGSYGYNRPTSPNLDRIAKNAVVFDRCYTSNSPCQPSRAALFSGRFGINNGIVGHHSVSEDFRYPGSGHSYDSRMPMFMLHLKRHGIKTVSFSSFGERHNAHWFSSGWSETHTFTNKMGNETADEVNAAVIPWLKAFGKQDNYFLHVHYWDIHANYRMEKKWADLFKKYPAPAWPDEEAIRANQKIYGPRTALDLYTGTEKTATQGLKSPVPDLMPDTISSREDFEKVINGYDGSLRYADEHVGKILEVLEQLKVLDDTAFIISSDHGDAFGELGHYFDHCAASEPVHHLPMIVSWPGITKSSRCDELVYQLDLCPTVCEMLGLPVPEWWDGKSFLPALKGSKFSGREYLVMDHGIYTLQRAVKTKQWLFTRNLHPGLYPYEEPYWLHHTAEDPCQTQDVAAKNPQVVAQLDHYLGDWLQEQAQRRGAYPGGPYPDTLQEMVSVGPFLYFTPEQMIERLNKTGREKQAQDLVRRLSRYHPDRFKPTLPAEVLKTM